MLIFHQLFERNTSSYTYLLRDPQTKEAVIIDPVLEMVERDLKLVEELELKLKYVLETHVHADHITGSGAIRENTGAKIAISAKYEMDCPDVLLKDGQQLDIGPFKVKAIATPGHTNGCMSYLVDNMVFTGDALLIRGCGRTDFQDGSSEILFTSAREKLFQLPDDCAVFPGHDYRGVEKSSIGLEKKFNPRLNLNISKKQFVEIMKGLDLPYPEKINQAVPANLLCGQKI